MMGTDANKMVEHHRASVTSTLIEYFGNKESATKFISEAKGDIYLVNRLCEITGARGYSPDCLDDLIFDLKQAATYQYEFALRTDDGNYHFPENKDGSYFQFYGPEGFKEMLTWAGILLDATGNEGIQVMITEVNGPFKGAMSNV